MKLYSVMWIHNGDLSKGKGRCKELVTGYTVLCNSQEEALKCMPYHWRHHYKESDSFDIEDGEVKIIRCKIDSRGFYCNYLLMDKMPEPIELNHIDESLYRYSKRFRV